MWASKAVVISTVGKFSHLELQQLLEQSGFSEVRISLLGEGCYLVAMKKDSDVKELLKLDLKTGGMRILGR